MHHPGYFEQVGLEMLGVQSSEHSEAKTGEGRVLTVVAVVAASVSTIACRETTFA
jgi:hypothetical protein